ncbi:hypothetical protein KR067_000263, partial [Drosophila pandora]
MQNSQVISKVNAGLRRCLSHHRRLCDNIAELDKLFCQDEFLMNPRRLWQLVQQQQNRQDEILGSQEKSEARTDMDSRMGVLSSKECLLSQTQLPSKISKANKNSQINRPLRKLLQPENSTRTKPNDSSNPRPAPTPLPSPERLPKKTPCGRPVR